MLVCMLVKKKSCASTIPLSDDSAVRLHFKTYALLLLPSAVNYNTIKGLYIYVKSDGRVFQ